MKALFVTFLLAIGSYLQAAGPVGHAYLSVRFFEHHPHYSESEKMAFMQGTLFPDIRYLGEVDREETHYSSMTLQEVLNEPSPFTAGVKFHSYVDIVREEFAESAGAYNLIAPLSLEHPAAFLKLVEDEILFPKLDGKTWVPAIEKNYPEEMTWGIEVYTIKKWHQYLILSLTWKPSSLIYALDLLKLSFGGIPHEMVSKWNRHLQEYTEKEELQNYVSDLIEYFEKKLSKNPS